MTQRSTRGGNIYRSDGTVINEADLLSGEGMNWTPFSEQKFAQRQNIIELKTGYGLSYHRDRVATSGSGTVTGTVGSAEFVLATTANGPDKAILESAEIARYVPGTTAEMGAGIRVPAALTGSQVARWGYFDADNGFGFGQDASGLFIFVRRNGTDEVIRRNSWNGDDILVDTARGNIFQISFAWYGFGRVEFNWVSDDSGLINLHTFRSENETSIEDPNQPIRVEIDNGGTATAQTLYVAGRQFSLYGEYNPNRRITSERRFEMGSIGDTFLPAISFRRKSAYGSASVKVAGIDLISSDDIFYEIRSGATLTSPTWGTPTNTSAAETATEVDVAATAVSGGDLLYAGMVGAAAGRSSSRVNEMGLDFDFVRDDPVTLCFRKFPSGTTAEATVILRVREEW